MSLLLNNHHCYCSVVIVVIIAIIVAIITVIFILIARTPMLMVHFALLSLLSARACPRCPAHRGDIEDGARPGAR